MVAKLSNSQVPGPNVSHCCSRHPLEWAKVLQALRSLLGWEALCVWKLEKHLEKMGGGIKWGGEGASGA